MKMGYVISIASPILSLFALSQIPVDKSGKYCLAFATFTAFQATFWTAVIPRLCYTGFSFAQPFLINTIIDVIGAPRPDHSRGAVGGLVAATALVYLGIAVRFDAERISFC